MNVRREVGEEVLLMGQDETNNRSCIRCAVSVVKQKHDVQYFKEQYDCNSPL